MKSEKNNGDATRVHDLNKEILEYNKLIKRADADYDRFINDINASKSFTVPEYVGFFQKDTSCPGMPDFFFPDYLKSFVENCSLDMQEFIRTNNRNIWYLYLKCSRIVK